MKKRRLAIALAVGLLAAGCRSNPRTGETEIATGGQVLLIILAIAAGVGIYFGFRALMDD